MKQQDSLGRPDTNLDRHSIVCKTQSHGNICYRDVFSIKEKLSMIWRLLLLFCYFMKSHRHFHFSVTTTLISQQILGPRQDPLTAKRSQLTEDSLIISSFSNRIFLVNYMIGFSARCNTILNTLQWIGNHLMNMVKWKTSGDFLYCNSLFVCCGRKWRS